MIRVGDLQRFARQMMPIRLRKTRSVKTWIEATLGRLSAETQRAQEKTIATVEEMHYTGQYQSLAELTEQRFGGLVHLVDSNVNGNIVLIAAEDERYREMIATVEGEPRFMAVSVRETDAGYGFTAEVESGADAGEVAAWLRRFVFLGVNFKIKTI